jgi:hypothetical protein
LKLVECGENIPKKDGHLIELLLMNLRTPYDMLYSAFHTNWRSCKEDGKDYTFNVSCDLLIKDRQKLIGEGKLGGKH